MPPEVPLLDAPDATPRPALPASGRGASVAANVAAEVSAQLVQLGSNEERRQLLGRLACQYASGDAMLSGVCSAASERGVLVSLADANDSFRRALAASSSSGSMSGSMSGSTSSSSAAASGSGSGSMSSACYEDDSSQEANRVREMHVYWQASIVPLLCTNGRPSLPALGRSTWRSW